MDFGTTIPFYFISICCFVVIPIVAIATLIFVRFSLKEKQLAQNMFITVIVFGIMPFLSAVLQLFWSFVTVILNGGCEETLDLTPEIMKDMFMSTLELAATLAVRGVGLGIMIACCIVLPITFALRHY